MADIKLNIVVNKPRTTTFRVAGKTLAEVKRNLDARDEWGLYDATQNLKSSAQVDGDGNIVSVSMTLNPVIEMPAWAGYSAATKEQKASWDAMCKALLAHENQHHAIQLEGVEDLKKAIKSAAKLDAETLDGLIEKAREDCQKQQDAYDSRTGHGAKQGVVLKLDA